MNTARTWRRSAITAAALLWAAAVALPVQAGIISIADAPMQVLATGDSEALTQALLAQDAADAPRPAMAANIPDPPAPRPEPGSNPFWQFWASEHAGLSSAPGMSSPSVLSSGGSGGSAPAALACWMFFNFSPPLTGRVIDRPHLILPTGPIFELLRPA